jgi:DNA-binding transcriptional regulator GbsR (MarR family)
MEPPFPAQGDASGGLVEERKRREIDPTMRVIGECVQELKAHPQADASTKERLESMLELLTVMTGLVDEILQMPAVGLRGLTKLRGKVIAMVGRKKS